MLKIQTRSKIFLAILSGLILFACLRHAGQEVTSTSVTTGNPTGIRIVFRKDSSPISLSGKVEIFAADQIPVSGYSPNPLLSLSLNEDSSIEIKNHLIASIHDSLWPKESIEGNSIRRINAVVSSDSLGIILKEIVFLKSGHEFRHAKSGIALTQVHFHSEIFAELNSVAEYITKTDTVRLGFSFDSEHHLFIYGTGFTAKGEDGVFKISNLPIGQHEAYLLRLPRGESLLTENDSTSVFSLIGGVNTARDSIHKGPEHVRVELPDSLKVKRETF